jgi:primosomal protein N' (replication factor Y) (superfamily II helicase)
LVRSAGLRGSHASRNPGAVRVSLLIPTHSLPPLSYRVPKRLSSQTRVGAAVVAPLSGYPRLGIVLATEPEDYHAREDLWAVLGELSLPVDLVELCRWVSQASAVALPVVLRAALPPGLNTSRYRILDPAPQWPWRSGSYVGRALLKRALGREGLKAAEVEGRIELAPVTPVGEAVEWAVAVDGASPNLKRAPRQRELFDLLSRCEDGYPTQVLLSETGASRSTLLALVERRAVRLVRRPNPPPVFAVGGDAMSAGSLEPFSRGAKRTVERGGAYLWRTPTREQPDAVAAMARAAIKKGWQVLVLAPEIEEVERLVHHLRTSLPAGSTVAPYHSGLGRDRAAVYETVRRGKVDVVVGTRAAALLPFARLGAICVVDEPNEAHRAEPGYEGLPIHVREVALERGCIEGAGVLCLSPFPSLRLYGGRDLVRELQPRLAREWPSVRLVDMRGSGAILSSTLLDACRRSLEKQYRVGVVANRLGYATAVACNRCGAVRSCPACDLPLTLYERTKLLVCTRCGHREEATGKCKGCASDRLLPTGLTVERVREEISSSLGERVGLITARNREQEDAPVVVGTARCILQNEWDALIIPDADAFLLGGAIGAVERAFRLLYAAAEVSHQLLLIQTRLPEHYALHAAMRGDYPAFAAAELPRLFTQGYPPFAHLASLTFTGPEAAVRGAVELRLRPVLEQGVEMSAPVPLARGGGSPTWRVLLRSPDRSVVARAGTLAARLAAKTHGLRVRVDVDPEEV